MDSACASEAGQINVCVGGDRVAIITKGTNGKFYWDTGNYFNPPFVFTKAEELQVKLDQVKANYGTATAGDDD